MDVGMYFNSFVLAQTLTSFRTVEFETYDDLKRAINFLDNTEYRGYTVKCVADVCF
jgi:hypothetical protein